MLLTSSSRFISRLLVISVGYAAVTACGDDDEGNVPSAGGKAGSGGSAGTIGGSAGGSNGGRMGAGTGGVGGSGGDNAITGAGEGGTVTAGDAGAGAEAPIGGESGEAGQTGSGGATGGTTGGGQGGEAGEAGASAAGSAGEGGDGGGTAALDGCTPSISAAVGTHVASMKLVGWAARNLDNGIEMFGCEDAESPAECLSSYPRAFGIAAGGIWENVIGGIPGAQIRVLRTIGYATNYRTRASADGRFIAHGYNGTGTSDLAFIDLAASKLIPSVANYEPAFFPDLSGFLAQRSGGAGICEHAVLSASPDSVAFTEPACATNGSTGLELSVGAAFNGGKYYLVSGDFAADNGGHDATLADPVAFESPSAEVDFVRAIFDGTNFEQDASVATAATPDRIDASISPSAALLATRVSRPDGSEFASAGYALAAVTFTPITGATFSVTTTEIARYCELGGMPTFSYDERWLTYHHYLDENDAKDLGFEDASDVNFAAYLSDGAANVYILDLPTGTRHRVTNMAPGQYALYPHFRSDGWLYFVVRDTNTGSEYLAASNAAIRAASD